MATNVLGKCSAGRMNEVRAMVNNAKSMQVLLILPRISSAEVIRICATEGDIAKLVMKLTIVVHNMDDHDMLSTVAGDCHLKKKNRPLDKVASVTMSSANMAKYNFRSFCSNIICLLRLMSPEEPFLDRLRAKIRF